MIFGISCLVYKGFRNYKKNEIIEESNSYIIFSDSNSKFKKLTSSDSEYKSNKALLKKIGGIKDSIITIFLNNTKEEVLFFALDKDTLDIKISKEQDYYYSSKLDRGVYDKRFNDLLFISLKPLLLKNGINEIEVYTLTPTEYKNIPPPPGTKTNFEY